MDVVQKDKFEDLPFVDLMSLDFSWDDPAVAAARERSWVGRTRVGLIVLRYADVQALARDPRLIRDDQSLLERQGITSGPVYDWFSDSIINQSGEDHRRLRRTAAQGFTARVIGQIQSLIHDNVRRLAQRLTTDPSAQCDFVDVFADPLSALIECRIFGIPDEQIEAFHGWSRDFGLVFSLLARESPDDLGGPALTARVEEAVVRLSEYVEKLLTEQTESLRPGLVHGIIGAYRNGVLSESELHNLLVGLLAAAHDPMVQQLGHTMVIFAQHPDQWQLLAQRSDLAARAAEEVLRWCPMSPFTTRTAAVDFEYEGMHIAAGTRVWLGFHSAHRDPRAIADGNTFDITAERATPHLAFGGGPHHCLGAVLARAELTETLSVLPALLGPPEIAGTISWRAPFGNTGPDSLPLRFAAR